MEKLACNWTVHRAPCNVSVHHRKYRMKTQLYLPNLNQAVPCPDATKGYYTSNPPFPHSTTAHTSLRAVSCKL